MIDDEGDGSEVSSGSGMKKLFLECFERFIHGKRHLCDLIGLNDVIEKCLLLGHRKVDLHLLFIGIALRCESCTALLRAIAWTTLWISLV